MIPVIIQDYINKLLEKTTRPESSQFYYGTLVRIRDSINKALTQYDQERKSKK
jgi:hypothetical protein